VVAAHDNSVRVAPGGVQCETELDARVGAADDRSMTDDAARGQLTGTAADVYEQLFVPAIFAQWPPVLLDAAGVQTGERVLDVGCGTGVLAAAARRRVGAAGRVVGLDPNEPMLTVARRRSEPIEWWSASAEAMPFADGVFDRVVSQFALMYFADRAAGLAEMARVTAPGGRVAISTWAAADESPGYAVLIQVVERTLGGDAADALRAPFGLGDAAVLRALVADSFTGVAVHQHPGIARFASIESMVHTEIRGWTLAATIDDEQYGQLLAAARRELAPLVDADAAGGIRFAMPALVATGGA
jgi:SAM-dependent methyltransferase